MLYSGVFMPQAFPHFKLGIQSNSFALESLIRVRIYLLFRLECKCNPFTSLQSVPKVMLLRQ